MDMYTLQADEALPVMDEELDQEAFDALEDKEVAYAVRSAHLASAESVNVENVITLTARLAQVLAEEADLLADMRIAGIESLQREKMLLARALEKQKKMFDRFPEKRHEISDEEYDRLEQIIGIFESIMRENYRRLLVAKEVNRKVVEAIAEAVSDAAVQGFYDKHGAASMAAQGGLSVTVDKRI
jgi:flagellar biosynthesis/type III secretory pathway chaperone